MASTGEAGKRRFGADDGGSRRGREWRRRGRAADPPGPGRPARRCRGSRRPTDRSTSRTMPASKPSTATTGSERAAILPLREEIARVATDHQPHQPGRIDAGQRLVRRARAVLQHGHVVAERQHLVQAMRDVEDGGAFLAQTLQQALQRLRLMRGERGGRLVEDEHARLAIERLGDLHHLPPAERKARRPGFRVVPPSPTSSQAAASPARQLGIVDEAEAPGIGAEPDVLGNREVAGKAQLLLDHGDAGSPGLRGRQMRRRRGRRSRSRRRPGGARRKRC